MYIFLFALGISLLILAHEAGHFLVAKKFGLLVEEFGFGFPPRLFKKKKGDTVYSFNLLPLGGFVKIHGEYKDESENQIPEKSFWNLAAWKRFLIIGAGIFVNFLMGWIFLSLVLMVGSKPNVFVTSVSDNSPAKSAGFLEGDKIIGFEKTEEFINFVNQNKGKEVNFEVERGGKEISLKSTPRINPPEGQGSLGIALSDSGIEKSGFFSSIYKGFTGSLFIMKSIYINLGQLVVGIFSDHSIFKDLVGPVGIFKVASDASKFGFIYILQLLALISFNLAALNSIPFPALDGGRILFIAIEKIKGSPLKRQTEGIMNAVGFLLLILLMVFITVKDIAKFF
ncbi:MAG: RIP metalloprotease RseP [Candidatus Pacebacteria bacterium]|nr:RIP metalloprotease RseP [Candidatus Paceibacterota bacterium]